MSIATITRTFSLIPTSPDKKQMYKKFHTYLIKFRDLENLFIKTLYYALKKGKLALHDFSGTSTSHIKQKIYNRLELNKIKATQFKSIHFKERVHRCAIVYPYHAIRNWLIRNENLRIILTELIEYFRADRTHLLWFLTGKQPPKQIVKQLFHVLKKDIFDTHQYLTSFHIINMVRQLRNIFLSTTQLHYLILERLQAIRKDNTHIEQFRNICLSSFYRIKKQKQITLTPEELPFYFLERYFRKIKWLSSRNGKKKMNTQDFIYFKKKRDENWLVLKENYLHQLTQFSSIELKSMMMMTIQDVFTELETHSSNHLVHHIFHPFFQRIRVDYHNPKYDPFLSFFQKQLEYKVKEKLKDLILTESIGTCIISELEKMKTTLPELTSIPKIKKLSIPIQNLKETQIYNSNLEKLKIKLSFVSREFHTFSIKDKKERIRQFLEKGASECPPVICWKQGKMLYHLPFEVKKTRSSKQAYHEKKKHIELGIDLGLKHFTVLSIMDKSEQTHPKEIFRYFISQKQLFDMKFNTTTGKFELKKRTPHQQLTNPTNIKLKLINIRKEIRHIQQKLHTYENHFMKGESINYKKKFKYNRLKRWLSLLWDKVSNINKEIVHLLNHSILSIANYHNVSIIKCENLKWAKNSKRKQVGQFLAFWQTHWFYSQIQQAIQLQCYLNNIRFQPINARYTSQKCSQSGHIGQRIGKSFFCPECHMSLDSDLNAARNIALCES